MRNIEIKNVRNPDERRPFVGHGEAKIYKLEEGTVGLATFEPGWRWSSDVKPLAGTASCEVEHSGFVSSGRMIIRMDSGEEVELKAGDFAHIPPGHDAWVVGDEPCVMIDWNGMAHYAQSSKMREDLIQPEMQT